MKQSIIPIKADHINSEHYGWILQKPDREADGEDEYIRYWHRIGPFDGFSTYCYLIKI